MDLVIDSRLKTHDVGIPLFHIESSSGQLNTTHQLSIVMKIPYDPKYNIYGSPDRRLLDDP